MCCTECGAAVVVVSVVGVAVSLDLYRCDGVSTNKSVSFSQGELTCTAREGGEMHDDIDEVSCGDVDAECIDDVTNESLTAKDGCVLNDEIDDMHDGDSDAECIDDVSVVMTGVVLMCGGV